MAILTLPLYDIGEVRKHDQEGDAWMVIEGYVHDVTTFLMEHPGGKDVMMDHLGRDATEAFTSDQIHAHGHVAFKMLSKYRIGILKQARVVDRMVNEDYSKLVDVTKPILPQIVPLGAKYSPWVHSQMGLQKIIIFDNFFEQLSRWPWWYIFVMWPPFMAYVLSISFQKAGLLVTLFAFITGALSWGIVEYTLHRFLFHMETKTPFWNKFHFFAHGIHHLTPNDSTRLTFPPTFSVVITVAIYQLTNVFSHEAGIHGFLAGLACGFMLYDAIHFYFHHGDAAWFPNFLKRMKTAHLNHHYKDDTTNFGVTSQLFDYAFGTVGSSK